MGLDSASRFQHLKLVKKIWVKMWQVVFNVKLVMKEPIFILLMLPFAKILFAYGVVNNMNCISKMSDLIGFYSHYIYELKTAKLLEQAHCHYLCSTNN